MKLLKDVIFEKFIINKNTKSNPHNEEVLCLSNIGNNGEIPIFDCGLFIHGFNQFYKKYNTADIVLSINIDNQTIYFDINDLSQAYKITKEWINGNDIIGIYLSKEPENKEILNINSPILNKFFNFFKRHNYKYFRFCYWKNENLFNSCNNMYMWYSKTKNILYIHLTQKNYSELLKIGYFD